MSGFEIGLVVVIFILLLLLVGAFSVNDEKEKEIRKLKNENGYLRLNKVFVRPLVNYNVQNYELRIKCRDERIEELEKENNSLKKESSLTKPKDSDDMFIISFPQLNGKSLYLNEIRQQFIKDLIFKQPCISPAYDLKIKAKDETINKLEETIETLKKEISKSNSDCCSNNKSVPFVPKEEVVQCICGSNSFIEFEDSKLIKEVGVAPYYSTKLQCTKCGKVHDLKEKVEGYSRYQRNFI